MIKYIYKIYLEEIIMAKGSTAKSVVENKIAQAFGSDYIGIFDKKLYVWADDGGEKVQIAIALTCPKNFVEVGEINTISSSNSKTTSGAMDCTVNVNSKIEITPEEEQNIEALIAKLGL